MADTRKWQKTSIPGIYRQAGTRGVERVKVVYESRETKDGKTAMRQRTRVFTSVGDNRITVGSDSRRVTPFEMAKHYKAEQDSARKAGHTIDVAADETTLNDFWPRYIARGTKRGERRASTRDTIERSYRNHIAPTFGDVPMRAIKRADVDAWYTTLAVGPAAKKKAASTLRAIFNVAIKLDLAESNPAVVLDLPADSVRAIDVNEVPTGADIGKIKDAVEDRYRLMVDLLATGMRIGEVIGLRTGDVNLKGEVHVRRSLSEVGGQMVEGPTKTANGERTLELDYLRDDIQRHLGQYAEPVPNGYVFTGPDGSAPIQTSNWRTRVWYPALEEAGIAKFVPHALRHRVAWSLIDRGYTVDQVADWIGDTPQTVRAVYAHHPKIRSRSEIAAHLGEQHREANGIREGTGPRTGSGCTQLLRLTRLPAGLSAHPFPPRPGRRF